MTRHDCGAFAAWLTEGMILPRKADLWHFKRLNRLGATAKGGRVDPVEGLQGHHCNVTHAHSGRVSFPAR